MPPLWMGNLTFQNMIAFFAEYKKNVMLAHNTLATKHLSHKLPFSYSIKYTLISNFSPVGYKPHLTQG